MKLVQIKEDYINPLHIGFISIPENARHTLMIQVNGQALVYSFDKWSQATEAKDKLVSSVRKVQCPH